LGALKTLIVISPVYNEALVIEAFHHELNSQLHKLSHRYVSKILFVVDRCTDETLAILKKIAQSDPSVQILVLSSRFGHQMSLLAGIDHADADAIIMMDSDLQHPPQVIPELLEAFEKGNDVVYTIRKDADHTGFLKRNTSKWFYRMINRISQVPIIESAADFRLLSRRVAKIFREQIRERNMFLRGLISWVGFSQTAVSFTASPRAGGKSKYPLARLLSFSKAGVLSFSKKPLQAAIVVGVAFAGLGFIMALVTLIQYMMRISMPSGWTTLVIMLSVFSGVQLIFLGILGEYIGGIFDEVKGRPHYIVEEKINF